MKSEWITANAGSGKTTALTDRVVRLLLLGVVPERIVCITYTKAAASEMRARVLKKLRELLLMGDADCCARIEQLLGSPPSPEQLLRARQLFGLVLDSPTGGLQLTTTHGFCQNILRRFPLEAGLAPHFTVLEDAAADELLAHVKHALLGGLLSADADLQSALGIIGMRGGETRFDAWANDIVRKKREWRSIWHAQSADSLREHLWAFHGLTRETSVAQLREQLAASITDADEHLWRDALPGLLAHKTKTYREFGQAMADWLSIPHPERANACDAFIAMMLTKGHTRRQYLLDKKQHPEGTALHDALDRAVEQALRYVQQVAALHCAEESFAVAVFARALMQQYDAAKESRHALDFDDLITRTLQLCTMPEMVGWVMSKLDHRIDHLLIDEAQDNSAEQWQLARMLVEELIASNDGVGSANIPRSVLVVGDEKQSIYSFQGAAPEAFSANQQALAHMLGGSASPLNSRSLTNSYRSAAAVLHVVDRVCGLAHVARALTSDAVVHPHVLKREEAEGRVVLYPPVIAPEKESIAPLVIPTTYETSSNAPQQLAEHMADTIKQWLVTDKRMLASEGRPLRAGDILILVRKRTRIVHALIRALQRRDIPVAGMDRLTLSKHLAVGDLLGLMRWCGNVADDLALAQVLRSPLVGMSDAALCAHAHGRPGTLWAQVDNPWLRELRGLSMLSPYDFLTHVLEVSGKRTAFARRFGEEVHEVLDELKAQAAAMPEGMLPTIAHFHDWLDGSTREIKREQETGAMDHVRIMTVHGAKGLEARVVLLADTVSVPGTKDERFFVMKTTDQQPLPLLAMSDPAKESARLAEAKEEKRTKLMAEYYRLLYVALTRAQDELHIFGTASKKGDIPTDSWYAVVHQAMRDMQAMEQGEILVVEDAHAPRMVDAAASIAMPPTPLPAWATEPPRAEETPRGVLAPSRVIAAQPMPYATTLSPDARQRGVRIHRILEVLTADADEHSVARLVRHIGPDWDAKTQVDITAQVARLRANEPWLWSSSRFPEVSVSGEILVHGESVAISGQVDLLIQTEREAIVIDYKTSAQVPGSPAAVPESYVLQLKIYHALVSQLYPSLSVRCAILWTHNAQVMWLDDAVATLPFPAKNRVGNPPVAA